MKYNTDLAFDDINSNYNEIDINGFKVLKSKIGDNDFYLFDYFINCYSLIALIIKELINKHNLIDKKCLIVGLGNNDITPDSLGPRVNELVVTTSHLIENEKETEYKGNTMKVTPNVMGNTGIETFKMIKGIVNETNPDFIIVIDALKSNSLKRLNNSIQITDMGIKPGSGVKNERSEISFKTLLKPVIVIGVPLVVDLASIMNEMLVLLLKYLEQIRTNNKSLLIRKNLDLFVDENVKKMYLGYVGELNEEERYHLINSFLEHTNNNLIVATKDIDFIINDLKLEISKGINLALHKKV